MSRKPERKSFLDSQAFALADLFLVLLAGALWYGMPELGWLPLIPALLPWIVRLAARKLPFRRTPLDLLFLVLILTAWLGVWAAYDRERALQKFWLILDGVLLFYALANQPRANFRLLVWGMGGAAAALSVYFFLTHDWTIEPAKIGVLNRLGLAWMRIRPTLPTHVLHPNVVAGLTAMLAPFLAAAGLWEWRYRRRWLFVIAAAGFALVSAALLMTTSRGAWVAMAAALGLWLLWYAAAWIAVRSGFIRWKIYLVLLALLAAFGAAVVALTPGGLIGLANRLPGPSHTGSRLDLITAALWLIGDMPLTGGGLDSFTGNYSQYILITPFYILEHGHNLFLDVAFEQGIFGGMALIAILAVCVWKLFEAIRSGHFARDGRELILWAALSGMLAFSFHGLMDDTLYGSRAQFLLWAAPGLGMAVLIHTHRKKMAGPDVRAWATAGVAVLVMVIYALLFKEPLKALWLADRGAVEMAQAELADFPAGEWDDGGGAGVLALPAARFEAVLRIDPLNRTAHYRLGLIAMLERDYPSAVAHLEVAYNRAPDHPGIVKSLAYAYVWNGQPELAFDLIELVPDAGQEMRNYAGWWRTQGREDLAMNAESFLTLLGDEQ